MISTLIRQTSKNLKDYYKVLNVSSSCTSSELKEAYLELSKLNHPDKFPDDNEKEVQDSDLNVEITIFSHFRVS